MVVCGMELSSSEVRFAILSGNKTDFERVVANPRKLKLANAEDAEEVRAFRDAVHAFLRENAIEHAAIRKRNTKGEYAGSHMSFKLEGVIQLYTGCSVVLVSPQSVAAARRNHQPVMPPSFYKYQKSAFEAAFWALAAE